MRRGDDRIQLPAGAPFRDLTLSSRWASSIVRCSFMLESMEDRCAGSLPQAVNLSQSAITVKINMDDPTGLAAQGPFDARYVAFLETISSGAALAGSPNSGGYAGAKRTELFVASYSPAPIRSSRFLRDILARCCLLKIAGIAGQDGPKNRSAHAEAKTKKRSPTPRRSHKGRHHSFKKGVLSRRAARQVTEFLVSAGRAGLLRRAISEARTVVCPSSAVASNVSHPRNH